MSWVRNLILYLHIFFQKNTKYIVLDHEIKDIDFNLGDGTEAYFACTTVFEGETLVLGGKREYNQFSKVESCGLKRINTLPFTKNLYAQVYCGTYNFKRTFGQLLEDMESRSNDYGDDYSDDGNIDYGDDEVDLFKVKTIEIALICRHQQCFT